MTIQASIVEKDGVIWCPGGEHWVHPNERTRIRDHGRCQECHRKWQFGEFEQGWTREVQDGSG